MRAVGDRRDNGDAPTGMITTGVAGCTWRAAISPTGSVVERDGRRLDWFVAADDRWHDPAVDPAVRQRRRSGTPVTETRVRVPGGDVVQTVYSCADGGGVTVIEVANESPLPVAIAFTHRHVLTERPIVDVPIEGIDVPAGAFVLPLGHRARVRVGLPHRRLDRPGPLPSTLPTSGQVERGWNLLTERASRLLLPGGARGSALVERVTAERCELGLGAIADATDDPVGYVLGLHELVRMGDHPARWVPELAAAVESIAPDNGWDVDRALDAAATVLDLVGDTRAVGDVDRIRRRRRRSSLPPDPPDGVRLVAWLEARLTAGRELLPGGFPPEWCGRGFEVYGIPVDGLRTTVSFAVRWHGDRPALLWEQTGPPVELTAAACAPGWATSAARGEVLWPAPAG